MSSSSFLRIVVFFVLSTVSTAGMGVEISRDELKKVEARLQERETFQVKFSQMLKTGLRKREATSNGVAVFGKPNLFRWTLEFPAHQEMIYDGQSLTQFDKDARAATKLAPTADKRRELEEVIAAATSIDVLLGKYDLQKADRDTGSGDVTLDLKPKSSTQGIKAISLRVSATQNFVDLVRLDFSDGSSNRITFANPQPVKRNPDTFRFIPPAGVKVSEMR